MGAWLEEAFGPDPALALSYLWLAAALALLATVLHFRRQAGSPSESAAVRRYFASFFGLGLVVPCLIALLVSSDAPAVLASWGWTFGRHGLGLAMLAAAVPLAVLASAVGSRDPGMVRMYPLAKGACGSRREFLLYEASYVVLYYLPWEFVFRGLLFLPLVPSIGFIPALALQTMISTLLHIGHPDCEIFAAAGAGLMFGVLAWLTGSFVYGFVIHAAAGIATDTFLCRRRRKERP